MNTIQLPQEALGCKLSATGVDPIPMAKEAYDELGKILRSVQSYDDYENIYNISLEKIIKKENDLYKKKMRLWMFDVLEREYYFKKSTETLLPSFFSEHFYEIMFNLIKDDITQFQPEKYEQRLRNIYVTAEEENL